MTGNLTGGLVASHAAALGGHAGANGVRPDVSAAPWGERRSQVCWSALLDQAVK